MSPQQFAIYILQMLEKVTIPANRDHVKTVSDIYELLDGLASGDLTITPVEPEPKGSPDKVEGNG